MSTDRETDARIKMLELLLELKNQANHIKDRIRWRKILYYIDKLAGEVQK